MATEIIVFGIKIASMKRNLNLWETVENTHDLRKKIKDHLTVPENDIEGSVACQYPRRE